jgi:hypothetical protein
MFLRLQLPSIEIHYQFNNHAIRAAHNAFMKYGFIPKARQGELDQLV